MATYTSHYNLDKYESNDRPNLRDQYNAAMDKIDAQLYTQAGNISTAQQAVQTLQTQVTTNTGNITTLQSDITVMDRELTTAAANAASAIEALGGMEFDHITPSDSGTKWTTGTGCNSIEISALVIHEVGSSRGLIIGHLSGKITAAQPAGTAAWTDIQAVKLTEWGRQSGIAATSGDTPAFIQNNDFRIGGNTGQFIFRPDGTISIEWTKQLSEQIAANCEFWGSFAFPVTRLSA